MMASEDILYIVEHTHKYSKEVWTSKFGITYIGFGKRLTKYTLNSFPKMTKPKAKKLLKKDFKLISNRLNKLLNYKTIPQNHYDTMCSLIYDIGFTSFKNSKFFSMYQLGLYDEAASFIMTWSYIKLDLSVAMQYRRNIDKQIFTTGLYQLEMRTKK